MKINKILCLAVVMSLTACQNDEMTEAPVLPENGLNTLVGSVGTQMLSRAQIVLGNTEEGETFIWNSGDSLSLYDMDISEPSAHIFKISEEYNESNASATASFTTETALTAGHYYAAVYPSSGYTFENGTINNLELTYELDDYSDASWKKYFSKNMYMYATGIASSKGTTMQFKHLCYMIRLTYTNETGETQEVKSVEFMSGGLNHGGTYSVADEAWHGGYGMNQSITLANPLMAEAGKSYDFYLLFFPVSNDLKGTSITVGVNVGDNNYYTSDLSSEEVLAQNSGAVSYEAGKCYHFNVTHRANMSLAWSKNLTTTVKIDNVELSKALYDVLGSEKVTLDENNCAVMVKDDVLSVTELNIGWKDYKVSSLSGIEKFENLCFLYCEGIGLTSIDLSHNTKLVYLNCAYNNGLTSLDISGCTQLTSLECQSTALTALSVPRPEKLTRLNYGSTQLSLDLTEYTDLTFLGCGNLGLSSLNIPTALMSQLTELHCDNNQLTALDLSGFSNLRNLACYNNNLTSLDLSVVSSMNELNCSGNQIESLDVTPLTELNGLYCGNQQNDIIINVTMTTDQKVSWDNDWTYNENNGNVSVKTNTVSNTITLTNKELSKALYGVLGADKISFDADSCGVMKEEDVLAVTSLDFGWGEYTITSLNGIEFFINLQWLSCNQSNLVECDLSKNTKLIHLFLWGNQIESLDLSNNKSISTLDLGGNLKMSSLNIDNCMSLNCLYVDESKLTSLSIPNKSILRTLGYGYTNLSFNLNEFTSLTELRCYGHNYAALNLSATLKAQLQHLQCYYCEIDALDLSEYPKLTFLSCYNNNLTTLDVSKTPNLEYLNCHTNNIENLDITPLENLGTTIHVGRQRNELTLNLTMTENQKSTWDNYWSKESLNENINVIVSDSSTSNGI